MKTISDINLEIDEIINTLKENKSILTKSETAKLKKRIGYLRTIIMYLETEPNEEFIRSNIRKLKGLLAAKESQYSYWLKNVAPIGLSDKKYKSIYKSEHNLNNVKTQIKNLEFILK